MMFGVKSVGLSESVNEVVPVNENAERGVFVETPDGK
jgi:hypothetical protein